MNNKPGRKKDTQRRRENCIFDFFSLFPSSFLSSLRFAGEMTDAKDQIDDDVRLFQGELHRTGKSV